NGTFSDAIAIFTSSTKTLANKVVQNSTFFTASFTGTRIFRNCSTSIQN
ncbi:6846_t:CDS:1, partial [Dentiscutata erythropus]